MVPLIWESQESDARRVGISIAQHHGLPTRLLDWTYSPMIAVHFATSNMAEYSFDSAIWKVNFAEAHSLLQNEYINQLLQAGSNIFSIEDIAKSIPDLDKLSAKHSRVSDVAIFFEPPSTDERIVNQFSYFSALSDPFMDMDDWFAKPYVRSAVSITKIVIPASLKWRVRDHLDQSNVTERVLFPGLDGLCSWLKRHYTPI
jgi:FRG domain